MSKGSSKGGKKVGPERDANDILEENKLLADLQWKEEHKFQGPKRLDDDEISFLKAQEDQQRLRFLERELEDLKELEKFNKEVTQKVHSIPKETSTASSTTSAVSALHVLPKPKQSKAAKKEVVAPVIIPAQKRKTQDTTDGTNTKKLKEVPSATEQSSALAGLQAYDDDSSNED